MLFSSLFLRVAQQLQTPVTVLIPRRIKPDPHRPPLLSVQLVTDEFNRPGLRFGSSSRPLGTSMKLKLAFYVLFFQTIKRLSVESARLGPSSPNDDSSRRLAISGHLVKMPPPTSQKTLNVYTYSILRHEHFLNNGRSFTS